MGCTLRSKPGAHANAGNHHIEVERGLCLWCSSDFQKILSGLAQGLARVNGAISHVRVVVWHGHWSTSECVHLKVLLLTHRVITL